VITIVVVSGITSAAIPALGDRAWWVVPSAMFVVIVTLMALDRRRPLTLRWLGLAALGAVAMGVFLKLT
jgi:hypothetical protein